MDAETAGFKVAVEGTTATVTLLGPYETARPESAPYQAWTDNGDGNVTLNVEIVPGVYYAADSAAVRSVAGCARAAGVGSGERVARTAKQPQGPARRTPCA